MPEKGRHYDLIMMNPPFKGEIPLSFGNKEYMYKDKEYYIYHIIKACMLPFQGATDKRIILLCCPFLSSNERNQPKFNLYDSISNEMKKKLYYFFGIQIIDNVLQLPDAECEYLGVAKNFKRIQKNGTVSPAGLTMSLYKITVKPNTLYKIPSYEKYINFYKTQFKQPEIVFEQFNKYKEKMTKIINNIEALPKKSEVILEQLKQAKDSIKPTYTIYEPNIKIKNI
jgi:hypothetical protein